MSDSKIDELASELGKFSYRIGCRCKDCNRWRGEAKHIIDDSKLDILSSQEYMRIAPSRSGLGNRILATFEYYESEVDRLHSKIEELEKLNSDIPRLLTKELQFAKEASEAWLGRAYYKWHKHGMTLGGNYEMQLKDAYKKVQEEYLQEQWSDSAPSGLSYRVHNGKLEAGSMYLDAWTPDNIPVKDIEFVSELMKNAK